MTRLVRERVKAEPGAPVFGTVVIDCDFIVFLKISDDMLAARASKRGVNFSDAQNMQVQIGEEIRSSGITCVEYDVG